jgi:AcrR family transcriptional regulator
MEGAPLKQPTQARSRERVAQLISIAAREISSVGVGGFSMNALVKQAGVSPGSLYQYFPNRDAVFKAVFDMYSNELIGLVEQAHAQLSKLSSPTVRDVIDGLLVPAARFYRENPAYAELHHSLSRPYAPDFVDSMVDAAVLNYVSDALVRACRCKNGDSVQRASRLILEASHAILMSCDKSDPKESRAVEKELHTLLQSYIEARFPPR